jgi:hypothetical protein
VEKGSHTLESLWR